MQMMKFKKNLLLWNYFSKTLLINDPYVAPFFMNRERRPVSKMATITKNRNFFK